MSRPRWFVHEISGVDAEESVRVSSVRVASEVALASRLLRVVVVVVVEVLVLRGGRRDFEGGCISGFSLLFLPCSTWLPILTGRRSCFR